jgi:hypothetical protein
VRKIFAETLTLNFSHRCVFAESILIMIREEAEAQNARRRNEFMLEAPRTDAVDG